jgi:protease-4
VDKIAPFAEGRIFSGTQGHDDGLVDEIGGLQAAITKARELAKLPADADVEAVGGAHGIWAALGVASHEKPSGGGSVSSPQAGIPLVDVKGMSVASPGEVVERSLGRLSPSIAQYATGLVPLIEGEKTLALVPFAFVVR